MVRDGIDLAAVRAPYSHHGAGQQIAFSIHNGTFDRGCRRDNEVHQGRPPRFKHDRSLNREIADHLGAHGINSRGKTGDGETAVAVRDAAGVEGFSGHDGNELVGQRRTAGHRQGPLHGARCRRRHVDAGHEGLGTDNHAFRPLPNRARHMGVKVIDPRHQAGNGVGAGGRYAPDPSHPACLIHGIDAAVLGDLACVAGECS